MQRLTITAVVIMVGALILWAPPSHAASTVTLAWDYGTVPADLAGFRIYYGQAPGVTVAPANLAIEIPASARQAQTANMADGQACFVATAFDAKGNESAKSNEVCTELDTTAPPAPGNIRIEVVVKVEIP